MGRHRTWGLDTPRNPAWWDDALCHGKSQMYFTRKRQPADPGCGPWCAHLRQAVAQ